MARNAQNGADSRQAAQIIQAMQDITRSIRRASRPDMEALGLAPEQHRFLRTLDREGGAARPGELADLLHVTARSVTSKVDSAEQAGFVERQPDPADRRATIIRLTAAGRRVLEDAEAARARHARESLEVLTDEQCRTLDALLTAIRDQT